MHNVSKFLYTDEKTKILEICKHTINLKKMNIIFIRKNSGSALDYNSILLMM